MQINKTERANISVLQQYLLQHVYTNIHDKIRDMGKALSERLKQKSFSDPWTEAMLNVMVAADYIRKAMEGACEPFGISHTQYNVLRILRGAMPDGHPRCEISKRMIERAVDATRLIDKLERQGYVERVRSEVDRRLSITRITKKGVDLLAIVDPAVHAVGREYRQRLMMTEAEALAALLEKFYEESLNQENQDQENQDQEGQDQEGQDQENQDQEGQDQEGQDQENPSLDSLSQEDINNDILQRRDVKPDKLHSTSVL